MTTKSKCTVPNPHEKPYLTVPEAGALLGLGRGPAYRAAKAGQIPALKYGRSWRIPTARFLREVLGIEPENPGRPVRKRVRKSALPS